MPFLTVLANDQGEVIGTATTQIQGRGPDMPGRMSVVARPGQQVIEIEVGEEVLSLEPSALHEFIKRNYLRPAAKPVASAAQTAENHHAGSDAPREKSSSPGEDRDVVVTPAGPMPRNSVHPVRPDEAVRRNPDGSYTVVPKDPGTKDPGTKERSRRSPKTIDSKGKRTRPTSKTTGSNDKRKS
jgi:hypothetical protein